MSTRDDVQAAMIPAAGARVQGSGGAEDGGARHSSALGAVGRVTRQLAAQVCEGPAQHSEGGGSVLGLGDRGEQTRVTAAHRRTTAARGWSRPAGVAGAGGGGRRMGEDAEEGRLGVVRDLQDESAGCTHRRRAGASIPGHAAESSTGMDQIRPRRQRGVWRAGSRTGQSTT